MKPVKIY